MITALLATIALTEISRLFLTHRKMSKKRHFKQKLDGTERMLWDLEFKTFKTKEMREDIRKEYDFMNARIEAIDTTIKNWPKDKDEGEKKRAQDQKVLAERDRDRMKEQIKQLDLEVGGSKQTNDYPEGVSGIGDQVDGLKSLQAMLKDHIRSL